MRTSTLLRVLLPIVVLAGCTRPPPEAYGTGGRSSGSSVSSVPIGANAVNEACTQQVQGNGADVYCGTWQEPSARVRAAGPAGSGDLAALATSGPWRTGIDARFTCASPQSTTILGGAPALLMQCSRKVGGWPHVAMVALIGNQAWLADGVLPALPPMERAIGVLSGRARPEEAGRLPSNADALLANRLAARAFSSGDIGQFEGLMYAGMRANLASSPVAAERAYSAALALQRKALGADSPDTVLPLMHVALQLSNQGRFPEADALFAQADRLAPRATDPAAMARLLHYRALNALNQGRTAEASGLLDRAEAAYAQLIPPDALKDQAGLAAGPGASALPDQDVMVEPVVQSAVLGTIEVRRYRAVALGTQGRLPEAQASVQSATNLARANNLAQPIVLSRILRTEAALEDAGGQRDTALSGLYQSSTNFNRALPGSRSMADTVLLRVKRLVDDGRTSDAVPLCRETTQMLRDLRSGVTPGLIVPCLDAYAAEAKRRPSQEQALLAEMFLAAQFAQATLTSQQIAQASARLTENARDPKVAEAIRRQQDAAATLADVYRQRDELAIPTRRGDINTGTVPASLAKRIADAEQAVAEADSALQAASPNYGQLVQQVVPAADVLALLRAKEAFAAISLSPEASWTFLLRDGRILAARIQGGQAAVDALVKRIRAGVEAGADGQIPPFDDRAAQELYAALFSGMASPMDGLTALSVAPTGSLLSVPFSLLRTDAPGAKTAEAPYLLRQMSIAHVPAPANFVSLRKIAGGSRATHPWFGFGQFQRVSLAQAERSFPPGTCADSARLLAGLPTLPFAAPELEAARTTFGATKTDELLGSAFTVDAVRRAPLRDYRILHFATHGLLPTDLRCQTEPAVVASPPPGARDAASALLGASAVLGLQLDADAVILSACNTGGPSGAGGESLSGLARAFFYAGARSLLVTHWSGNDQVSAFLVANTLAKLQKDRSRGLAAVLREAQLELLNKAGGEMPAAVGHPANWALFALIGDGGGLVRTAQAGP